MCTVTIVPLADAPRLEGAALDLGLEEPAGLGGLRSGVWFGGVSRGFRLVCNRDEAAARPAARPPSPRRFGTRRALLPLDPQGGGTWLAVNDAGLALALLNAGGPGQGAGAETRLSRGLIIPALLHCGDVGEAVAAAAWIDPRAHAPFRLVLTDGGELAEISGDGAALRLRRAPLPERPVLFTSSSLGDAIVDRPRRILFDSIFAGRENAVRLQDRFHEHAWDDRPHLSVRMRRDDAHTVSRSVVTVLGGAATLVYTPLVPHVRAAADGAARPVAACSASPAAA